MYGFALTTYNVSFLIEKWVNQIICEKVFDSPFYSRKEICECGQTKYMYSQVQLIYEF